MKINWFKVLALLAAGLMIFGVGWGIGWAKGNPDRTGYEMQILDLSARLRAAEAIIARYENLIPDDDALVFNSDDELNTYILKQIISNADAANVSISMDNSGYSRGIISIYFNNE